MSVIASLSMLVDLFIKYKVQDAQILKELINLGLPKGKKLQNL